MSATLLWCVIVLAFHAAAAFINRHVPIMTQVTDQTSRIEWRVHCQEKKKPALIASLENDTLLLDDNGVLINSRHRKIVVEEVDKNGNSVVKELELPYHDDIEELQEDKRRLEQQKKEIEMPVSRQDIYGCEHGKGNQRRKCLRRRKKLLRRRYRNWKELICRIIKDLDRKIKTLGNEYGKESTTENLNFMSGFSPRNVMRKKE